MNIGIDWVVEEACLDEKETKKMKHRLSVGFLIVAAFVLGSVQSVAAAEESPTAFMKKKDGELKPLLENVKKNKQKIISKIGEMMDFDALSKASLGVHWIKRTSDEQKEFSETLQSLIEENLVNRLKDSKDHDIRYESEKVNELGTEGSVTTFLKTGAGKRAEEIEIVYMLKKKGNTWIAVDMVTDEVSLVGNYQSQFKKIIDDDGFDALMKRLRDKLAEEKGEKPAAAAPPPK